MSTIYILIPIAVLLTSIGIYLFFWAVKTEQFDDLEKQGMSILFDDEDKEDKEKKANNESSDNHDDSNSAALNSDNSTSDNK
ncbi:MAG: cbb3-type cytochrome oxidase maturation protein [Colwellia sp.]|jgi:cbb3-type cytochrome oxidase maturation protein